MGLATKILPIGLAALGTGYFAMTMLKKPVGAGPAALAEWERHKRDARIGLFAGLGAATLLLVIGGGGGEESIDRDSFA
jgi:hypothetical protein